jgi:signal transduction histidine kinase
MLWPNRLRWQLKLVIVLFVGSLAALIYSASATFVFPREQEKVKEQMQEASRKMAEAATGAVAVLPDRPGSSWDEINQRLGAIANAALADYPGVEGGFYLDAGWDRFGGFAFPTDTHRSSGSPARTDPPPREAEYIRLQAQQSLKQAGADPLVGDREVGPSRVVFVTEAVGKSRPARAATWLLYRLTKPETLEGQIRRYQLSVGLALGGFAVALLLTLNLGRALQRQRWEQEKLREELRRAEQLAALGKLLAGVAHEVRNPLAGIRSTVQLWQRLPDTAQTPESMEAVLRAVDRLNEIVRRLLYFSRADSADRQPLPVNDLLVETLTLIEAQAASQGKTLETELAANLPPVPGSANGLRQVFLNLCTNALQAMPQGGKLRARTSAGSGGRTVEVRFADNGPGVTAEDRKHLFEPFFTTRADGTGLGLALCREIVAQHGGHVRLEDAGPGATFCVTLPVEG